MRTIELEIGAQGFAQERGTCVPVVGPDNESPRTLKVGQVVIHRAPVPQGSPKLTGNLSIEYRVTSVSQINVAGESVTVAKAVRS